MKADVHPIVHEFLKGCSQLNLPRTDDFNGAQFEGAGIYDLNTKHGEAAQAASRTCVPRWAVRTSRCARACSCGA